jgi:ABC-type xylose transport system substrate-binding protein
VFTDTNTVYTHPTNHAISVISGLQGALDSKLASNANAVSATTATNATNATNAVNSDKVDGYHISVAATGSDANTIYFRV